MLFLSIFTLLALSVWQANLLALLPGFGNAVDWTTRRSPAYMGWTGPRILQGLPLHCAAFFQDIAG